MSNSSKAAGRYLVASDFDQTLSFNDSGRVLSEVVGIRGFDEKVAGLAKANLVQQGAELTVLSDSALSVLVPILEDILNWNSAQIRNVFESYNLAVQEWDKTRTDWLVFQQSIRPLSEKPPVGYGKTI